MGKRGRPPHPDILTPREWQVLALLRQGLTNEQIAQRLDISFATAKYHVAEIISKLGVQTREEAAAWQPEGVAMRWWQRAALAPLSGALRRLAPLTLAKAAIATGALVAVAGLAVVAVLLSRDGDDHFAETAAGSTPAPTRPFVARPAQTTSPVPTATLPGAIAPPAATSEPIQTSRLAGDTVARAKPNFPIPNAEGIRLSGGLYMVAPDGSGLAALALPDDPAAGAGSGFSTHSVSPDGRWLAYSPGPPRNTPDTPPGQTVYLKDLLGSQPA